MRALNIEVADGLLERWVEWFGPAVQPFVADAELASFVGEQTTGVSLSDEVRDTYCLYGLSSGLRYVWLDEAQFRDAARHHRSAPGCLRTFDRGLFRASDRGSLSWATRCDALMATGSCGGHRCWTAARLALTEYIEDGRRPSRHDEVPENVWDSAARILPNAQRLAGTFAGGSGPNSFGTVIAAAGGARCRHGMDAQREPFERRLTDKTRPGGHDDAPGTVLVWRSPDGLSQHAAVTLGDGWVLHKPSQGWMSPNKVLTTEECKAPPRPGDVRNATRSSRDPGAHEAGAIPDDPFAPYRDNRSSRLRNGTHPVRAAGSLTPTRWCRGAWR